MPQMVIYDATGNSKGEMTVKETVFQVPVKAGHLHAAVTKQLNNARVGTASCKTRADVSGGGKKPWKQKGTGRARHGSIRSPIWKGGGVAFGPHPRDYTTKLTKKMRRLAMKEALSSKVMAGELVVLEEIKMEKIRTKDFAQMMGSLKLDGKVLFVLKEYDEFVEKSGRNIEGVRIVKVEGLSIYDILHSNKVVFVKEALQKIEEVLS